MRCMELIRTGDNTIGEHIVPWEFRELGYQPPEKWDKGQENPAPVTTA